MRILFLSWLLVAISTNTNAQTDEKPIIEYHINDLNGVWQNGIDTNVFCLFKNGYSLTTFYYENKLNLFGSVDSYGFVNKTDTTFKEIKIKRNNKDDLFYWGGITSGFDFEDIGKIGGRMELVNVNVNVNVYRKVQNLPNIYIRGLYEQGKKDKRDYLKEFLSIDMHEITKVKSLIYRLPNIPTKIYLIKGNEIEILEEKGEWLRIRYYGKKTVEGWIKKSDVK